MAFLYTASGGWVRRYPYASGAQDDAKYFAGGVRGVTWDAADLYGAKYNDKLYHYDGWSTTVLASFAGSYPAYHRGITIDNSGNLIVAHWNNKKVVKYVGFSSTVDTELTFAYNPHDVTWADGNLYVTDYLNSKIRKYSSFSTTELANLSTGHYSIGVTYDGAYYYSASDVSAHYHRYNGFTLPIIDETTLASMYGIEVDDYASRTGAGGGGAKRLFSNRFNPFN